MSTDATTARRKVLHLNAFVMNTASHIHHGQWRRDDAGQTGFEDVRTWVELARTLEAARFDAMFFADVSGVYGDADADRSVYLREGLQIPSNDPAVLLGALAVSTEHIGLAYTSNVMQNHPFNFARQVSTLDHISGGRVAWNVVTGMQDNGARNFGLPRLTDHAERYRWAEEYVDVAYKLWEGSWEDDALLKDRERGVYSDPDKVHAIDHVGERYQVQGPHLPSPSPQRVPVLFQAGSSGSGLAFAARHAEAVFIMAPDPSVARELVDDLRARAVAEGRHGDDIKVFQGLSFVVGRTADEVAARVAVAEQHLSVDGYLAHAAVVREDGRVYPPDTPVREVETNTMKGFLEWARRRGDDPTLRDLAEERARSTRLVGTPTQVVDQVEEWQDAGVDGINVVNFVLPGSFVEFAELVLPELRARGLAQTEYAPGTLRRRLFGTDRVNERHPAARYRGAFGRAPAQVAG